MSTNRRPLLPALNSGTCDETDLRSVSNPFVGIYQAFKKSFTP